MVTCLLLQSSLAAETLPARPARSARCAAALNITCLIYLLIKIKHILILCFGNYIEVKNLPPKLGVLRVNVLGFGCPNDTQTLYWLRLWSHDYSCRVTWQQSTARLWLRWAVQQRSISVVSYFTPPLFLPWGHEGSWEMKARKMISLLMQPLLPASKEHTL